MEIKLIDQSDNRLRKISAPITDFSYNYKSIIDEMEKICLSVPAYACAAPQMGILERFILIIIKDQIYSNDLAGVSVTTTPYFNPRITNMVGEQCFWEACMSVKNTIGKVRRPYLIDIEFQDIEGNFHKRCVEGFEAIIFCHEIDHLDGIEYIDRAEEIINNIGPDERLEFRKTHPHIITSKTGEFKY